MYRALDAHHVWIEGTILATDVVDCGICCQEDSVKYSDAAGATLVALLRTVPASVPGADLCAVFYLIRNRSYFYAKMHGPEV